MVQSPVRAVVMTIASVLAATHFAAACGPASPTGAGGSGGVGGTGGATPLDAGSDANSFDATTLDTGSEPDAGDFDCLPECVRRALLRCAPVQTSCTFEHIPVDAGSGPSQFYTDTTCTASAEWRLETVVGFHSQVDTHWLNGAKCLERQTSWGSGFPGGTRWVDGTGTPIAVGVATSFGGGLYVACGSQIPTSAEGTVHVSGSCMAKFDRCLAKSDGTCP